MLIDESVKVEGLDAPKTKTGVSFGSGTGWWTTTVVPSGNLSTGNFFPMAVIPPYNQPGQQTLGLVI